MGDFLLCPQFDVNSMVGMTAFAGVSNIAMLLLAIMFLFIDIALNIVGVEQATVNKKPKGDLESGNQ
jgi:hypothetical protein